MPVILALLFLLFARSAHAEAPVNWGEDPATVKEPSVVADAIVAMLTTEFETGYRLVVSG